MKKFISLFLVFCIHIIGFGQNFNRPAPNVTGQYEFQRFDNTIQNKYYLLAPFTLTGPGSNAKPKMLYIVDEDGYVAWWTEFTKKQFDFKYHPEQGEYLFTRRDANGPTIFHYEMDESFNLVDSISSINGVAGDIHEFQIFPNGNRCILATMDSVMDLSSTLINGNFGVPNTTVVATVIQEFNPSGTLVFEWNSLDHLPPDHFGPGLINVNAFDYLHANSIELDEDNNLILSLRAANMACKINHQSGNVIWKLGGNFSDFAFTNDSGFYGQHDIRVLPNGNLSVFDNDHVADTSARGVEYQIDTVNFTATKVNESNYTFSFPARSLGSFRVLENDYRIAGWGNTNRPSPSVTLYDPLGDIASDFFMRDTVVSYRAFFQDLPNFPARPEINCQTIGNDLELSVSGIHNSYLWSTGETTSTIIINTPGTYQCWVDQGIGMLGSNGVTITDLNSCNEVGIGEIKISAPKIVGYTDLMGRTIKNPRPNEIYFVQFENGTVERRMNVINK